MIKFFAGVATALTVMYVKAVVAERIRHQRVMEEAHLFAKAAQTVNNAMMGKSHGG